MFIHSGFFAFQCEVEGCGQSFKTSSQLNAHTKKHSGIYLSLPCSFALAGLTAIYLYSSFFWLDVIQFFCNREGCTEGFTTWAKLNDHKRIAHRGIKKIKLGGTKEDLVAKILKTPRAPSHQEEVQQETDLTAADADPPASIPNDQPEHLNDNDL